MSELLSGLQYDLLGKYAIEREVGRGGMATVFLARDLKLDRAVAVKVLLPALAAALGVERFRREIQILTHLNHPHVLPIYASGEAGGSLYYVMPFIDGESLRAKLTREHQLSVEEAVRITLEVASALDYAHRHDIIHRDIKPENILLEDGQAIVADFGIARVVSAAGDERLTQTGVTLGTPSYMSPEQGTGERILDGRSDLYSLGCVLYEMLAGQPPFTGGTAQAIIARHTIDDVPSLATVRRTIPEELEDVIMCALAKVPADRYPTVADFAAALTAASAAMPMRRSTTRRATVRGGRRHGVSRARKTVFAASAIFAVAVVAAGGWLLTRTRTSEAGSLGGRLDPSRVAVLYFDDESKDRKLTPLADGLTEELIDELSGVKGLDVVSKGGVGPLRSASLDSAASALKAGSLVRGTVEEEAGRIRVSVRLFDGNSGTEFRRATFERPTGDVFAVRDTLAQQVAQFLRERLGEEIRLREERAGTQNADAWLFVRQAEREAVTGESLAAADSGKAASARFATADSILAQAERLDPRWPAPVIARASLVQRQIRFQKNEQRLARLVDTGLTHADRAVGLDPRNPDALEVRGSLRFTKMVRGLAPDPRESADLLQGAEEDLRKAVSISPSQAGAWTALSRLYYRKYNKVEANLAARRAYEADAYLNSAPEILWRLYVTSYDLEQFVDAANWCDLAARRYPRDPMFVRCRLWLLTATDREPDVDEGWRLAAKFDSLAPPNAREMMRREAQLPIAAALGRRGLRDSAHRVLVRARADRSIDPRGDLMSYEAAIRVMIGDTDEAIRLLKVFLTANPLHREGYIKNQTWWWRPLQNDPRFKELVGSGD